MNTLIAFAFLLVTTTIACEQDWKCHRATSTPTLDGDLSEWENVDSYTTSLTMINQQVYGGGDSNFKCMYDDSQIYFSLVIPGEFRFNATSDKLCAAIATMMKIGEEASFYNMGNCVETLAEGECDAGVVPDVCLSHRVDIGAHWELSGTKQGVLYGINVDSDGNLDDEWAVNPYCRKDDSSGFEWTGAWLHTNPVDGEMGDYIFELSRDMTTASSEMDAQMTPGNTYEFGIAFWDPNEMSTGWSDAGHYVTGCGNNWISLELVVDSDSITTKKEATTSSSSILSTNFIMLFFLIVSATSFI